MERLYKINSLEGIKSNRAEINPAPAHRVLNQEKRKVAENTGRNEGLPHINNHYYYLYKS